MKKKRLLGILAIGTLYIAAGIAGVMSFILFPKYTLYWMSKFPAYLIGYILLLAIGVGVIKLKKWGHLGALTLHMAGLAHGVWVIIVYRLIIKTPIKWNTPIVAIILGGVVIYYLTRPAVKEQFK